MIDQSSAVDVLGLLLDPGEEFRWKGAPSATRGFDRQDLGFLVAAGVAPLWAWTLSLFGFVPSAAFVPRVIIPLFLFIFLAIVRPFVRRLQTRNTAFGITDSRILLRVGRPFPSLQIANRPVPYKLWRRPDGRGTLVFTLPPTSTRSRLPLSFRRVFDTVLYLLGLTSRPFPRRVSGQSELVFYEVDHIDDVVRALGGLVPAATDSTGSTQHELAEAERWFTPARRMTCGVLGVMLAASSFSVVAWRWHNYLQHSPTTSGSGTMTVPLRPGTYVLFERTAKAGPYDCYPKSVCVTITPADVSVASSGREAPVVFRDPSRDGITYYQLHLAGAVEFHVQSKATYVVTIHAIRSAFFVLSLQPSQELISLLGWAISAALGIALIAVAVMATVAARGRLVGAPR
jgi:hypothetical protein